MYLNKLKCSCLISPNVSLKEVKLTIAVRSLQLERAFFSEDMLSVFCRFVLTVLASLRPEGQGKILLYPVYTNA